MDKVYKKITLIGTSTESFEKAIENAVERASETLRHLDWFEVKELRGRISDGRVSEFQAVIEVGFRLADH